MSFLVAAVTLALGAFTVYLVAANVLIGTSLLRRIINDGPERLSVEYASAWSLWPGRVRVLGFRIKDRSPSTEWSISLDEGRASIGLLDLLRRRFHPSHVRGTGLVVRVRSRLTPEEATPQRLAWLPPIPGFPDPPLRPPSSLRTPPSRWTTRIDDIAVDAVREIWVDDYHYLGGATLLGGMELVPQNRLEIFPSSLEVHGGVLRFANETVTAVEAARLQVLVRGYDPHDVPGSTFLRFMTGTGRVEGRIESVRFLNEMLHIPEYLRLDGGSGSLVAELSLDQGRGKGSLDFATTGVRAVMPDTVMSGRAEGRLLLAALDLHAGSADFAKSHVEVRDVLVQRDGEEPWPWRARVDLLTGELRTDPPRVFHTRIGLRAPNARPLYRVFDLKLPHWAEHLLKLKDLEAQVDLALDPTYVNMTSLDAAGGSFRILGRYRFKKASRGTGRGQFLLDAGSLSLGVGVERGQANLKLWRARKWFHEDAG